MKNNLSLALLSIILSFKLFAQQDVQLSPNGFFDKVYTRYGDTVALKDLITDNRYNSNGEPKALLLCSSGYFDLYFEIGSGMEGNSAIEINRRNILCQVFTDISQFIVTPNPTVKVNILVKNINSTLPGYNPVSNPMPAVSSNVLGLATGYYVVPAFSPSISGIVDNEIWKTINSGVDSYTNVVSPLITNSGGGASFFHGMVAINFSNPAVNWHLNLNQTTSNGLYDMYSVALHEVTHALGFSSLIDVNGNSKIGLNYPYYSRYDLNLKTQANVPLIANTGSCSMFNYGFNPSLNTSVLAPSALNCTNQIKYAGSINQLAYTPAVFTNESSLSHLDDMCHLPNNYLNNEYYVMTSSTSTGATYMKRYLKPEERKVLCDIGYMVGTTFGSSSNLNQMIYSGNVCDGIQVVGVNDGFTALGQFQNITTVGAAPLTINNVCLNDYNTISFECLEDVYGNGIVSNTSGTSFSYVASTPGVALLRYIPVSANGNRGNITYIFIYISPASCPPSACSILSNADFENATTCGPLNNPAHPALLDCWAPISNSPDILQRNCTNTFPAFNPAFNIPNSTFSSPPSDSWNGIPNNSFLGLISGPMGTNATWNYNESAQTSFGTPLIPGNTYTINFYAKVGNIYNGNAIPPNTIGQILIGGSSTPLIPFSGIFNTFPASITQLGAPITILNNNTWQLCTSTFTCTSTSPLNNFVIANSTNMSSL